MTTSISEISLLCITLLLSLALLPGSVVRLRSRTVRQLVSLLVGLNALAAVGVLVRALAIGPTHLVLGSPTLSAPLAVSVYTDSVSALMLLLVSVIGWVICQFSVRYLDGEPMQGRYFRWTGFTIGAVSLVVVAGNLPILILALLLTSLGLHPLLVHYGDRPSGRRAAAIKFFFSRLGDLCLMGAAILLYQAFGTLELPDLFAAVNAADVNAGASDKLPVAVGWLILMCAVFKSAQFPFHTWLPDTMEAPTPVSALMHAGIVNAGGYLLIRLSPIFVHSSGAMTMAAGIGGVTALLAALTMLSQTSVKRSLAYSTIAQMGFMILQCGLGAFSAAMLHIIAHSLYKAYSFLSSGSVLADPASSAVQPRSARSPAAQVLSFTFSAAVTTAIFLGLASVFGLSISEKPGGFLLGLVLCLGLTRWMTGLLQNGTAFLLPGLATCIALVSLYFGGFVIVDAIVAPISNSGPFPLTMSGMMVTVAIAFACLFMAESLTLRTANSKWLSALYVHSSSGFYVDAVWRRLFAPFTA